MIVTGIEVTLDSFTTNTISSPNWEITASLCTRKAVQLSPAGRIARASMPCIRVWLGLNRILTGKVGSFNQWIEYVGRDHLHHRMAQLLGSNKRSVFFIYLLTACFGISAVILRNASTGDAMLLLFQAVCMVIMVTVLERIGRNKAE